VRSPAIASLRGLALGDAFGETWFSKSSAFLDRALSERWVPAPPWHWTDDTAMALSVIAVLRTSGHIDQDALAARFAREHARDPDRKYGHSMHDVLGSIHAGEPWSRAAARQFDGAGSWGNGAAMRAAPLGAWFADDLDAVVTEATRSAVVTHAHPEAAAGAVAVAVAAALNVRGLAADDLLHEVASRTPDSEVATGVRRATKVARRANPHAAAAILGCGQTISAMDTVPFALWCAARHLDDLTEALWTTASPGGDVDTTCAIVGGIVAARTGVDAVPAEWSAACEPLPAWVMDG
jgi:ADP-ribosylglycohydrolase